MIVFWTANAKRELQAVYDYIAQNSSRYAQGMVDRITRKSKILADFPRIGAEVAEYENESIRELFEHPYRIIYKVTAKRIEILSIVHAARQLPPHIGGTVPPHIGSTD